MFIIESTAPRTIGFGTKLYIQPMINKVDAKLWEELKKSGYARAIKAMEDEGTLIIKKKAKLTSAIVKKTYDSISQYFSSVKGMGSRGGRKNKKSPKATENCHTKGISPA